MKDDLPGARSENNVCAVQPDWFHIEDSFRRMVDSVVHNAIFILDPLRPDATSSRGVGSRI